jgi:hypothetical protein
VFRKKADPPCRTAAGEVSPKADNPPRMKKFAIGE